MNPEERRVTLREQQRELSLVEGLPRSPSKDQRVEELEARIDYLRKPVKPPKNKLRRR